MSLFCCLLILAYPVLENRVELFFSMIIMIASAHLTLLKVLKLDLWISNPNAFQRYNTSLNLPTILSPLILNNCSTEPQVQIECFQFDE